MMNKLLVVCGPTAIGKTDVAIHLAKKFHGELINADSRQVYKELDIITGKDIPRNSEFHSQNSILHINNIFFDVGFRDKEGIPIWLVDIVKPNYFFNVGEFQLLAQKVMKNIWSRNKLPIVVGGTGLFIQALIKPLSYVHIPPNDALRNRLQTLTVQELGSELQRVAMLRWKKMNLSDKKNPRRLIRAIEIAMSSKKETDFSDKVTVDSLHIGLYQSVEKLTEKIYSRVDTRMARGALGEAKKVIDMYGSESFPALTSTGLKQLKEYLTGSNTLEEVIGKWKLSERQYSKRQMTWFKKQHDIRWFSVSDKDYREEIENLVKAWYTVIEEK